MTENEPKRTIAEKLVNTEGRAIEVLEGIAEGGYNKAEARVEAARCLLEHVRERKSHNEKLRSAANV